VQIFGRFGAGTAPEIGKNELKKAISEKVSMAIPGNWLATA